MKNIKQVCTLLFLLFSACLFGQGHVMEIKDLGYIPGNETLRVYAVYEDDTTLDLITVRNGVTRYQSSDPENDDMVTNNPEFYRIGPDLKEIRIEHGYIFTLGCGSGGCTNPIIVEMPTEFRIPIDTDQCYINQSFNEEFTLSIPNEGTLTTPVTIEIGFDYEIVPFLTIENAVESQLAGYEHPLQVVATPDSLATEVYQWEYQLREWGSGPQENGWRNFPEGVKDDDFESHILSV